MCIRDRGSGSYPARARGEGDGASASAPTRLLDQHALDIDVYKRQPFRSMAAALSVSSKEKRMVSGR